MLWVYSLHRKHEENIIVKITEILHTEWVKIQVFIIFFYFKNREIPNFVS